MINFIFIIGIILLMSVTVYHSPKLWIWSFTNLIYLLVFSHWFSVAHNLLVIWTSIFIIVSLLNIRVLRNIITYKIFTILKSLKAHLSETEKLALTAGNSWYEKDLLLGIPDFNKLHHYSKFILSEEEQQFIDNEVTAVCALVDEWQVTHVEHDLSLATWDFIRAKGFLGIVIDKKYGGKGFSPLAHSQIVTKLATKSTSLAVTVMVPNSLGPGELLQHYGTEEQKNYYLPRLATGEEIPCFALTGPTVGSDATAIPDKGVVCYGQYNNQRVLGIELSNVDKRYITLAPIATLIGLAFNLHDPDNLLAGVGKTGITCALLPHNYTGLEIGNRLLPLDQAFMNGTIRIKQTFIPMEFIIGGQQMAGSGWKMLVECLSIGRAISLPACGTGQSILATITTSAYAKIRQQFNSEIGSFEGVEAALATMGGITYMLNATRQFTVNAVANNLKPAVASAIAKYHLTENARHVLNNAMDIHGGKAIMMGKNNYLASAYQAIPIAITVEGANIMTRNLLIYGQGIMLNHPFLANIYTALNDDDFNKFDTNLCGFCGRISQIKVRSYFHAITAGIFANGYKSSEFHKYYKQITRMSAALSFISECTILFVGAKLKYRERLSARLGDALSYLYMACATLKFYQDNNKHVNDKLFVEWTLQHCLYNTQESLIAALDNFNVFFLGSILKRVLFLYGRPYMKPNDKLEHKVTEQLLTNSSVRQRLKDICYLDDIPNNPTGKLEKAYLLWLETTTARQKVAQAVKTKQLSKDSGDVYLAANDKGIISDNEYQAIKQALNIINDVIQVDEFSPYHFGTKNAHSDWQTA
jgi:acyl-CoA dehydrogenase